MNEHSQQMIAYITYDIVRNPLITIEPDTPLISSGLIDSFALVDILVRLEEVTGRKIPAGEGAAAGPGYRAQYAGGCRAAGQVIGVS